jgi:glycosyltransferase involved in cell wall biosynthesis
MKIVFVVQGFRQGGANRSLQYLLPALKRPELEISVYALSQQGPYRDVFAAYSLVEEDFLASTLLSEIGKEKLSFRRMLRWFLRSVFRLARISGISLHTFFFRQARKKIIQKGFDLVIAFQEGTATEFVAALTGVRKIAWVHSDYPNYLRLAGRKPEVELYQSFDELVCVSEFTAENFKSLLPSLAQRVRVINNVMDCSSIRIQAKETPSHPSFILDGHTLISVGRLDPVKRFSAIPAIAAVLKSHSLRFRWFLIGEGSSAEREQILIERKHWGVEDELVLLGELANPYPYIAAADLLVSLSLSEACPLGVQEAKILKIPVLSSDYGSATEFVKEGQGGVVLPFNELGNTLAEWLEEGSKLLALKDELENFSFSNDAIVEKVEALLNTNQ